jgi:hypothetical protein
MQSPARRRNCRVKTVHDRGVGFDVMYAGVDDNGNEKVSLW